MSDPVQSLPDAVQPVKGVCVGGERIRPFFRPQIDAEIQAKLEKLKKEQRYHGSMATYVENILDKYADGLLVEVRDAAERPIRAEFRSEERRVGKECRSGWSEDD